MDCNEPKPTRLEPSCQNGASMPTAKYTFVPDDGNPDAGEVYDHLGNYIGYGHVKGDTIHVHHGYKPKPGLEKR